MMYQTQKYSKQFYHLVRRYISDSCFTAVVSLMPCLVTETGFTSFRWVASVCSPTAIRNTCDAYRECGPRASHLSSWEKFILILLSVQWQSFTWYECKFTEKMLSILMAGQSVSSSCDVTDLREHTKMVAPHFVRGSHSCGDGMLVFFDIFVSPSIKDLAMTLYHPNNYYSN